MTAQPLISLRNISHHFGQGTLRTQVLFDISADIGPGEIVIVAGPSGSGKTTMLTLAGALRSVMAGSLNFLGQELRGASADALMRVRRKVGYIFQHHHLLRSLTSLQNVMMGLGVTGPRPAQARKEATAILEAVGLGSHLHHFPEQLSGGQRQRVAVARALVRQPTVILADEPTASLDRHTGREVVELLRNLARAQGAAILIASHDHRILDLSDRVMYLEDGRLSSFASATSAHAGHLLTAIAYTPSERDAALLVDRMPEADFLDFLRAAGSESEQYLNVLDFAAAGPANVTFRKIAGAALGRVAQIVKCNAARLWMPDGKNTPRCVLGEAATSLPEAAIATCLGAGEIWMEGGTRLCIALDNREGERFGMLEIADRNVPFDASDARVLRDFSRPLAFLLQAYSRVPAS